MRTNGFEKPFSKDQVTSWVLQPLIMSCFIAFVAKLLDRDKCLAILIPNAVLVITVLASWAICEARDPAQPRNASSWSCFRVPPKPTRYCTICCKNSPGLDHHCTWLNTCIGERNYEAFYCLVVAATTQTLGQAVIGILMATLWFDDVQAHVRTEWHDPLFALLWVHNAICLSLANSYFLLASFHTYLLYVGTGTYDFILTNGSDGLCARLLKCKCHWLSRNKPKSKRSHVADSSGSSKQQLPGATATSTAVVPSARRTKGPSLPTEDAMRAAAAAAAADKKQQDVAQWKSEWIAKHGVDDSDNDSSGDATLTEATAYNRNNEHTDRQSSGSPASLVAGNSDKVSAKRTSAYPTELVRDGSSIAESHVRMSMASINESEDIFDVDVAATNAASQAPRTAESAVGPKTEL